MATLRFVVKECACVLVIVAGGCGGRRCQIAFKQSREKRRRMREVFSLRTRVEGVDQACGHVFKLDRVRAFVNLQKLRGRWLKLSQHLGLLQGVD